MTRRLSTLGAAAAALLLAGCASVAPDGLRGAVQAHTQDRLPAGAAMPAPDSAARQEAQARIAQWLDEPIDADTAVRIALLNNPGLQARLAQLALQDAERAQALTLINPTLSLARMTSPHEREIERQLGLNLVQLIAMPWRARWLGWQMERATLDAAQQVLALAADTRRAWLRAVAARQVLAAHERMHEAAQVGGELATRMAKVGNFSRLQQARQLSVQHDSAAQLARARLAAALESEQLARLMGLWGPQAQLALPDRLPALPAANDLRRGDDAEATALRERLDLRALRRDLDSAAERSGWVGVGAVFGDLGLSYSRNTATERANGHSEVTRGWELDIALPLFDWGGAATAGARAELQRSAAQLRATALDARSQARSSWLRYRTAWDLAQQQRAEVLPLSQLRQDEAVLRYNGMFISTWELLAQARATTQAVATGTEMQRDFWLTEVDLRLALHAGSPGAVAAPDTRAAAASPTSAPGH